MKHFILSLGFILIVLSSLSQSFKNPKFPKEKYVQKKRVCNIIGYSFLATSAIFFVRGQVLADRHLKANPNNKPGFVGLGETIMGGITGLASVPFFLVAAHYKNKAYSLSVNKEQNLLLQQNTFVQSTHAGITLKFNF